MALGDDKEQARLTRLQQQAQKIKDLRIDNAIKNLSSYAEGREFLWWLLQVGKYGTQPMTSNALTTAFNCGELNVGQSIMARIVTVDPAVYVRMQQEQQADYDRTISANNSADRTVAGPADSAEHPGGYDHPDLDS